MKKIVLEFKSTQEVEGNQDAMEFISNGEYKNDNGKITIKYDESVALGVENTVSTLTVSKDNIVTISRMGAVNNNLVIEQGKRHICQYKTPYGDITMGIYGDYVNNQLGSPDGELHMQYSIDVNMELLSKNKVDIKISEDEN